MSEFNYLQDTKILRKDKGECITIEKVNNVSEDSFCLFLFCKHGANKERLRSRHIGAPLIIDEFNDEDDSIPRAKVKPRRPTSF